MKTIKVLFLLLTVSCQAAFVAIDNGEILYSEGDIHERYSPCSTFKIALSVMGFDSGILEDEHQPTWDYFEEYATLLPDILESWKQPHDPQLWIQNSCVRYSQILTQILGYEQFDRYVKLFEYGNCDLQNDLLYAWLMKSLKISPMEQVVFIEKLLNQLLPVSGLAQKMSTRLLYREELENGWTLYGKTGSGSVDSFSNGWFVGWIQKGDRKILFAQHLFEEKVEGVPGSFLAVQKAMKNLENCFNSEL